jgi:RNA-directed DNA polymerase
MKIDKTHIEKIRSAFERMQTKNDLLNLMNFAKPLVYGEKAKPFELKQLTWHANPKVNKKRYQEFTIAKKSGGVRTINAPNSGLKSIQKTLAFILQCVFEPHKAAHGFVRNKSIVDNAKLHVGQNYVYNIDLKDFFPSIDQARVWKCFQLRPFNLNKETSILPKHMKWEDFKLKNLSDFGEPTFYVQENKLFVPTPLGNIFFEKNLNPGKQKYIYLKNKTFSEDDFIGEKWVVNQLPSKLDIANTLVSICCTEMEVERKNSMREWEKVKRNVLPQGAPTSPVITNVICQRLDFYLTEVAKRFNLKYSRYADDITFSSMHNIYQKDGEFLSEIQKIITQQGFHIKESKTRLQKQGYRQEVTGITVNERPNVHQKYIKQLRMWLYYWESYGFDRAETFFLQQYAKDKGHLLKGQANMINVIAGKLDYLKMVKGGESGVYLGLKERFGLLINRNNDIDKILEIWEKEGIEKTMELFYLNNSV